MINKKFFLLGVAMLTSSLLLAPKVGLQPSLALDKFTSDLDKRKADGSIKRSLVGIKKGDFKSLSAKRQVLIDIKVVLDGKTKYQVMTRSEGDTRRYNVGCRFGAWGQLPMGFGIEYFVKTGIVGGEEVNLVVYPGSRSEHPDNDISCVFDKRFPKSAVLHVRGLYKVTANNYPKRTDVQFRPISRANLSAEDLKKLQ
ncbi:MAG: hypothetical protein GY927_03845 [bacterium]|nr:hypothetical protein [bacterium]